MYERLKEMQTAAVGLGVRGKGKKNKSAFTMHKTGNPNQHKDKVQNRHFKELKNQKILITTSISAMVFIVINIKINFVLKMYSILMYQKV